MTTHEIVNMIKTIRNNYTNKVINSEELIKELDNLVQNIDNESNNSMDIKQSLINGILRNQENE